MHFQKQSLKTADKQGRSKQWNSCSWRHTFIGIWLPKSPEILKLLSFFSVSQLTRLLLFLGYEGGKPLKSPAMRLCVLLITVIT